MSTKATTKKVYIKTFGCQMNVYDSSRMADALTADGYGETESPSDADLIILNTCHIREKAAEKVYSELGRIRQIKFARQYKGQETVVAVAGCVAQAEGEEITQRAPIVDIVIGPQNYFRLPKLLSRLRNGEKAIVETEFLEEDKFHHLPQQKRQRDPSAFLTVQEGCDKFCTFCVVPYTRGVEYSRSVAGILQEARTLIDEGVKEITLLGQNVNAYHGENETGRETSLAELIARLAELDGLARIRYTTSHPVDMTDELIQAHADIPKLMPYLHLPFQAGSNHILVGMNRKHTIESYIDIIEKLRAARPDIALSTDIIVGFPEESDDDFEQTMNVVHKIKFAQSYSFKYSPRPGTPAASMEQLPEQLKLERLHRLQGVLREQQLDFNRQCVGRTLKVLVEKSGREPGELIGRSPYLQLVHVSGNPRLIGKIVDVNIQSAGPNSLKGVIKTAKEPVMPLSQNSAYV